MEKSKNNSRQRSPKNAEKAVEDVKSGRQYKNIHFLKDFLKIEKKAWPAKLPQKFENLDFGPKPINKLNSKTGSVLTKK